MHPTRGTWACVAVVCSDLILTHGAIQATSQRVELARDDQPIHARFLSSSVRST